MKTIAMQEHGKVITTTTYSLDIFKGEWIGSEVTTLGLTIKPVVSKWYYAIRNFVLVVMMVILLYIGIRIILASVSSEKAKYKNMLTDWVVAICLVFVMHYIMSFAMNLVEGITDIFSTLGNGEERYINIYELSPIVEQNLGNELASDKFGLDINDYIVKEADGKTHYQIKSGDSFNFDTGENKFKAGNKLLEWDAGNMVGMARIQASLCESGNITYIGWAMVYVVLVFFTVFFFVTYVKRALYLTFFTIIAPLVAMTYPIDKMHDGKAQAFDMWLKEYIFNLMIQPVHLLLYTVLISCAFELASTNILYTLAAIGFMMPAEKFIRKMFGFDKAQTPGFLSGAAGAALMMTGMNKLFNRRPSKGGGSKDDDDDNEKSGSKKKGGIHKNPNTGLFGQRAGAGTAAGAGVSKSSGSSSSASSSGSSGRRAGVRLARGGANTAAAKAKSYTLKGGGKVQRKNETEKLGFFKRQWRGIKGASRDYWDHKLTRAAKNIKNGKPIRDMARFVGGAYMGLAGGLLGATAGLMSGDAKNVTGYATTLGAAGIALGSRKPESDPDAEDAYEEYQKGSAEDPEEYALEQQRRKIIENDSNVDIIKEHLGCSSRAEARKIMQEYGDVLDYGVTDMDDFAAIIQLEQDGKMDREMGTVVSQYYKKAGGKPKNMAPDSKELKHIRHICEEVAKSNGLENQADIDASVDEMLKNLNLYGKYKDGLTEV